MARAITTLVTTFLFGLFGLSIGWANMLTQMMTQPKSHSVSTDALLFSYGVLPLAGTVIGFALSVVVLKWLFPASSQT